MISQQTSTVPTDASLGSVGRGEPSDLCTHLDWDSAFFGKRIARLNKSRLTASNVSKALAWCDNDKVDCLYFLADADDARTTRLAEQNDFVEVDVRVTLGRPITQENQLPLSMDSRVRLARESDVAVLRKLARTLHHGTRFYSDAHFERAKCDLLYETWIEKSLEDSAQIVFVPEVESQPVGYIACHALGQETQIGLLGVEEAHARTGLGRSLVQRFLAWSAQQGALRATVVTQARNTGATGLYQHCGFLPLSVQRWYHRWFTHN